MRPQELHVDFENGRTTMGSWHAKRSSSVSLFETVNYDWSIVRPTLSCMHETRTFLHRPHQERIPHNKEARVRVNESYQIRVNTLNPLL